MKAINIIIIGALALFSLSVHAGLSRIIDSDGQLTGAKNVSVGNKLYDVDFVAGSCITVFGGCNDNASFLFKTAGDAFDASSALLEQVFIDIEGGAQFDSSPKLTKGCESSTDCTVLTPYSVFEAFSQEFFNFSFARNVQNNIKDLVSASAQNLAFDTPATTYAVWRVAEVSEVSEVPTPTAFSLFALSIFGLLTVRRR